MRIIHIDDSKSDFQITSYNLKKIDDTVEATWVDSGQEAIPLLKDKKFDCILCDYEMPLMNGLQFLEIIRQDGINIPFIFLTGQGNEKVAAEAFRKGADDYFTKEESIAHYDRLYNCIARLIRAERTHRKLTASQNRFKDLMEQAPFPIEIYDKDGLQLSVNKAYEDMWGIKAEDSVGKFNVITAKQTKEMNLLDYVEKAYSGTPVILPAFKWDASKEIGKGKARHIETKIYPLRDDNNEINGVAIVHEDITYKVSFQNALNSSEDRIRFIAENVPGTVFQFEITKNGVWSFPYISRSIKNLIGHSAEEVVDDINVALDTIHPDDFEDVKDAILESYESLETFHLTFRCNASDGKLKYVETLSMPTMKHEGHVIWSGIFRDVTDSELTRKEEKKHALSYKRYIEHAPIAMFVADEDGNYIDVNNAGCELTGFSREEILSMNIVDLRHASALDEGSENIFADLKSNGNANAEIYLNRKKGVPVAVQFDAVKLPNDTFMAYARDLSKRTSYETRLKKLLDETVQRKEEIEGFFTGTKAVLTSTNFEETARQIFDTACSLTGAVSGYVALLSDDGAENELLFLEAGGLPCTVDENLPMPIRGLRAEAYKYDKVVYDNDFMKSEWVKFMPGGHVNLKNVLFAPLTIEGKVVGIMGLANKKEDFNSNDAKIAGVFGELAALALQNARFREDKITSEELLMRRKEQLETMVEDLRSFSSAVSHDLRAPLRRIAGFTSILSADHGNDLSVGGQELLAMITQSHEELKQTVEAILTLSRVQSENIEKQDVDISSMAQEVASSLKSAEPDRTVAVSIAENLKASGDSKMLKVMLQNLISNAWKFTNKKRKASIEIGLDKLNGTEVFFVKDNGAGFDPSASDNLFKPFKRLHKQSDFEGTGVGLATVKRVVRRHGGKIWAESKPGKGAKFYFTLSPETDVDKINSEDKKGY